MNEIKVVVFDIDGVLTDGMVYVDEQGCESKAYRLTEIDALNDLINDGIQLVAITGEDTPIVDVFERRVSWKEFVRGCKDKLSEVKRICDTYNVGRESVCYIGDGKYDIPAIEYSGLGVCPANAIAQVKSIADIVLSGCGGDNCINELYELITKRNREIKKDD